MFHRFAVTFLGLLVAFATVSAATSSAQAQQSVVHVDASSSNTAAPSSSNPASTWTGTTGAYAYLQHGLTRAGQLLVDNPSIPIEIRVRGATGAGLTYKPDLGNGLTPGTRTLSFELRRLVTVSGQYTGSGDTRDPAYLTTLSGDIGTASVTTDNSYHVMTASDGDMLHTNTLVQGFTIRDGNGNGNGADAGGGGVKVSGGASPRFDRCIITLNLAGGSEDPPSEGFPSSYGAGVQSVNSAPVFTRCTISNNASTSSSGAAYGGGVAVQGDAAEDPVLLINCHITGNSSRRGGGVAVKNLGVATLVNCLLHSNTATSGGGFAGFGGGISIDKNGNVTVLDCTIVDNTAPNGDGIALVNEGGNVCTVRTASCGEPSPLAAQPPSTSPRARWWSPTAMSKAARLSREPGISMPTPTLIPRTTPSAIRRRSTPAITPTCRRTPAT